VLDALITFHFKKEIFYAILNLSTGVSRFSKNWGGVSQNFRKLSRIFEKFSKKNRKFSIIGGASRPQSPPIGTPLLKYNFPRTSLTIGLGPLGIFLMNSPRAD